MARSLRILALGPWIAGAFLASGMIRAQDRAGFSYGDLKEVTLRGSLIPLGETMARKYGARVEAGAPQQLGLALPEGQIYLFLETAAWRRLAESPQRPAAVEVKARQFPRSMLLELLEWKPTDAGSLRRVFHCNVCNIDGDEWGPCPCCGKEFLPATPGAGGS